MVVLSDHTGAQIFRRAQSSASTEQGVAIRAMRSFAKMEGTRRSSPKGPSRSRSASTRSSRSRASRGATSSRASSPRPSATPVVYAYDLASTQGTYVNGILSDGGTSLTLGGDSSVRMLWHVQG